MRPAYLWAKNSAMKTYPLDEMTTRLLAEFASVRHEPVQSEFWDALAEGHPTEEESLALRLITKRLVHYKTLRVNEATIWARAIYPLLMLAERDSIRAFSAVPLAATFGEAEVRGEVDGALAQSQDEELSTPYLLIVEAKRGVAARDPVAQLLASLLCAARLNGQEGGPSREIFGCYTIADVWTFVRAAIDLNPPRPVISVLSSSEYWEKNEAASIVAILKSIIGRYSPQDSGVVKAT